MNSHRNGTLDSIRREAQDRFAGARGSHDWGHTQRVLALCRHLGAVEGGDPFVLEAAALLHDIGREAQDRSRGKICHAQHGARLAAGILRRHGVAQEDADRIIRCVRTHRFRGKHEPDSLEARILYDADKLDSIGAVGIGRAFLFAGEVGATLHVTSAEGGLGETYSREDTAWREYQVKLCRIRDRMLTAEGRRLAGERHRFMEEFFTRLDREVDGIL